MADDQLEWVFDSLVEFLRGPIWNIPVLTFIEQKSVVFEPGAENEEELKKIHEAYKNLVDFMLGSYMEDLKISPEEFERSCSVASKKALNQFHQNLFQQVWAADDFEIFKRMMTQKNLELQLQALEFLTQKRGSVPDCMEPAGRIKDEKEMDEIIKKAIVETEPHLESITPADAVLQEKMQQVAEQEKQLLEQAIKLSVKENISETCTEDTLLQSEKEIEDSQVTENVKSVDLIQDDDVHRDEPEGSDERVIDVHEETSDVDSKEEKINGVDQCTEDLMIMKIEENLPQNSSAETLLPFIATDQRPWSEGDSSVYTQVQVEVSPLELEKRQNYLRQQRDRILALKKQERARRLSTSEEVMAQARPKSARAARKILREESTEVDPQTLAFRKSLAAKLRNEVVDKAD